MAQPHSSSHPREVSAATEGLWRICWSSFCGRDENPGLLPTSGNLASFLHSFTRRDLEEALCKKKSPQSGGLDAQRGKRSLCPCLRGEYKGPPFLWLGPLLHLLIPTNSSSPFSFMLNKHNGCCLLQWILSCWDKWCGLLGSCPKNW